MNVDALRQHMFDTLQGLKDKSMDIETAKAMAEVGQVLINSAKVENDFIRANNGGGSTFFGGEVKQITQTQTGTKQVTGNVTVHKLHG
jgi:hypothetical protein